MRIRISSIHERVVCARACVALSRGRCWVHWCVLSCVGSVCGLCGALCEERVRGARACGVCGVCACGCVCVLCGFCLRSSPLPVPLRQCSSDRGSDTGGPNSGALCPGSLAGLLCLRHPQGLPAQLSALLPRVAACSSELASAAHGDGLQRLPALTSSLLPHRGTVRGQARNPGGRGQPERAERGERARHRGRPALRPPSSAGTWTVARVPQRFF